MLLLSCTPSLQRAQRGQRSANVQESRILVSPGCTCERVGRSRLRARRTDTPFCGRCSSPASLLRRRGGLALESKSSHDPRGSPVFGVTPALQRGEFPVGLITPRLGAVETVAAHQPLCRVNVESYVAECPEFRVPKP